MRVIRLYRPVDLYIRLVRHPITTHFLDHRSKSDSLICCISTGYEPIWLILRSKHPISSFTIAQNSLHTDSPTVTDLKVKQTINPLMDTSDKCKVCEKYVLRRRLKSEAIKRPLIIVFSLNSLIR